MDLLLQLLHAGCQTHIHAGVHTHTDAHTHAHARVHTRQPLHVNDFCPWRVCFRPRYTHVRTRFGSAVPVPVAVPLTPHLQLSTPAACQSSGPQTETWDWPTTTKEDLIDRRRQRGARTVTELCVGRWRMMLVSGSLGSCAADTGDDVTAFSLSSHQIQSLICTSLFCGEKYAAARSDPFPPYLVWISAVKSRKTNSRYLHETFLQFLATASRDWPRTLFALLQKHLEEPPVVIRSPFHCQIRNVKHISRCASN